MLKDFSWSGVAAGFVAVLIGFTSSAAIIFQAAVAAGATPGQISSWIFALGLGMGVTCIGLSLYYRSPVVTAWSTPGAALLITGLAGLTMPQAIGVFMFFSYATLRRHRLVCQSHEPYSDFYRCRDASRYSGALRHGCVRRHEA